MDGDGDVVGAGASYAEGGSLVAAIDGDGDGVVDYASAAFVFDDGAVAAAVVARFCGAGVGAKPAFAGACSCGRVASRFGAWGLGWS